MFTDEEKEILLRDVAEIKRGLYGESHNNQDGVIKRVSKLEEWKGSIDQKLIWVSGAFATITGMKWFYDWWKHQ